MSNLTLAFLVASAVGSGMMAGLFCSFSGFVMRALARIPASAGIAAMQSINVVIVNPAFLLVFFGTGVTCVLTVLLGWGHLGEEALPWAIAGGIAYVIGSILVTIAFNVPLNDRLAAVDSGSVEGKRMWDLYLVRWLRWNHLRSIATIASTTFLVIAALHTE